MCGLVLALLLGAWFHYDSTSRRTVETIWGESYECEDALVEIMETDLMQRLKKIDQSGPSRYLGPIVPAFSRFEHSVGVVALLKKAGAPLKEQIAGLLHDCSHTVFSHVGDYIFAGDMNENVQQSYQDRIHLNHLQRSGLSATIAKYGMRIEDLNPELYVRLERPLPDMCADRIQYNVHTGVIFGIISNADAEAIVANLEFENGNWYFTDKDLAKKFAGLSLHFTRNFWGVKWNTSMNIHLAMAIRRALTIKLISMKDLFMTDDIIMKKLQASNDSIIKNNLWQCANYTKRIQGARYSKMKITSKFRGIDPPVRNAETGELERLTAIDPDFKKQYDAVKKWCNDGVEIDILTE
jgi:HD superfamily phosphohydrolase